MRLLCTHLLTIHLGMSLTYPHPHSFVQFNYSMFFPPFDTGRSVLFCVPGVSFDSDRCSKANKASPTPPRNKKTRLGRQVDPALEPAAVRVHQACGFRVFMYIYIYIYYIHLLYIYIPIMYIYIYIIHIYIYINVLYICIHIIYEVYGVSV